MQSSIENEQVQAGQVQLSEKAKQNLLNSAAIWKGESEWVKLEDSETRVLQFNPERMKFVEGQFGIRMRYEVIDPNFSDKGYKKFEAGKKLSNGIDSYLRQNITLLKITRKGTGTETEYTVEPVA